MLLGIMALLPWLFVIRWKEYRSVFFMLTIPPTLILLWVGISLPMIEIDARIDKMEIYFLSSRIHFDEQIIYYRAKSILQLFDVLIRDSAYSSKVVGLLVLLFSVIFPAIKLMAAIVYVKMKERTHAIVRFIALNTAKWSMADVMAVSIFMAYVGFSNIVDSQLKDVNYHSETLNLISTNRTKLLPAYLVFIAFCLSNLLLAVILRKLMKSDSSEPGSE